MPDAHNQFFSQIIHLRPAGALVNGQRQHAAGHGYCQRVAVGARVMAKLLPMDEQADAVTPQLLVNNVALAII